MLSMVQLAYALDFILGFKGLPLWPLISYTKSTLEGSDRVLFCWGEGKDLGRDCFEVQGRPFGSKCGPEAL